MQHLQKIISAVGKFMERDSCLLKLGGHEQAITHRIAVYLEAGFQGCRKITVDCEYNKHLDTSKRGNFSYADFEVEKEKYGICGCEACSNSASELNLHEKLFRPDILVRSRGNDDANLIAVEIKTNIVCAFDVTKLRALTRLKVNGGEYGYRLGLFLCFPNLQPKYEWIFPSATN